MRTPTPHDSAVKHVTGQATYIDDMREPAGTLHLAPGYAPIASGRVTALDLEPVLKAPGVVAVLTAEDIPGHNDISPKEIGDDPVITPERVNFYGQVLFCVIAETRDQAKELRRLARTRPNAPLDLARIAEEIQDLGKREYETTFSLTQWIIEHLLLIEHSPATDQHLHWCDEIDDFRDAIDRRLSPSIRRRLKRDLDTAFARAARRVRRKMERYGETQAAGGLPAKCPYTLEQLLGDWLPRD